MGKPSDLLADTGYLSERNVTLCLDQDITPSISTSRQRHNVPLAERLKPLLEGEPAATNDPVEVMALRLGTAAGRALYAKRKSTIEPTFGIIKHVLGFRQFLLRGLVAVEGEWDLVCIAFNLKRLHVLSG